MNRLDLAGRATVVTGGARGIGYATAERALKSGSVVSLWDVDTARLDHARTALSSLGRVEAQVLELTAEESVQVATDETIDKLGKIDVLINNAGITGGNEAMTSPGSCLRTCGVASSRSIWSALISPAAQWFPGC